MKKCHVCKNNFIPNGNAQKNCEECRNKNCFYCKKKFLVLDGQWSKKFCSKKCVGMSKKGIYPVNLKGKRGIKPRTYHLREHPKHSGTEYIEWRNSVYRRDDYTCQECKRTSNELKKLKIKIHADHIKPFCTFVDLRYALENGRTLCAECHKKTDTYGIKARNFTPKARIEAVSYTPTLL